MVDILLDLFGEEKLRDIKVGVALSGFVIERVIVWPPRRERAACGDEAAGKLPGQRAAATISAIDR